MTDLEQLALKCETASGPTNALGREVLLACGWRQTNVGHFHGPLYHWSSPDGRISFDDDHFYRYDPTGSLDAAMSLVPEGFCADTQQRRLNTALFTRSEKAWAQIESIDGATTQSEAIASTPALALTAACLRAKAALAQELGR